MKLSKSRLTSPNSPRNEKHFGQTVTFFPLGSTKAATATKTISHTRNSSSKYFTTFKDEKLAPTQKFFG